MGEFQPLIDKLADLELDGLSAENLGDLSLREVVDVLKFVRRELEAGESLDANEIPTSVRNEILGGNFTNPLDQLLAGMRKYGSDSQNPTQERNQFKSTADALRDKVITHLRPIVRFDEAKVQREMADLVHLRDEVTETLDELKKQQSALAQSSATHAASDLSHFYTAQSSTHGGAATMFLYLGIGAAAALTALTVWFFFLTPPDYTATGTSEQWIEVARNTLARLVLLGIAGFVLAFCVRNYRVNMHLEVLNKRRENALNTFGLMQASVTSDEARNIVVGELVRAIFMHEDTGYLTTDTERTVVESPGGITSAVAAMSRNREA